MIRLTWRQFRVQAWLAAAALAALAVFFALTWPHLSHLYQATIAGCQAHGTCRSASFALTSKYGPEGEALGAVMLAVPVLTGVLWGAPLVAHELESGTYRLAWTQGVTRQRWLAVKLVVLGLASVTVTGLFALLISWWSGPLDVTGAPRLAPGNFDERGVVPVGYAAFAFAAGVAAGLVLRRTVPAIAAAFAAYVGVRAAVTYWVRPQLFRPATLTAPLTSGNGPLLTPDGSGGLRVIVQPPDAPQLNGGWIYSARPVDASGHVASSQLASSICGRGLFRLSPGAQQVRPGAGGGAAGSGGGPHGPPAGALRAQSDCIARLSARLHTLVTYQPASRFWPLQAWETAIFAALALALAGACFWWIRHRLS